MVVLICFVGHDYQRILDGVNYWRLKEPIENIYLIYDRKRDKYGQASRANVEDLSKALTFAGQQPELVGVNPQSYEDVFVSIYGILRSRADEEGRRVLIDVTSTTKEAYGAVVTTSLMFPNVSIYVVPPAERGWYIPEASTKEYEEWFNRVRSMRGLPPQEIYLPGFRLEELTSEEEERVLLALESYGGSASSIKNLIEWCNEDPNNPAVKSKYSRLIAKLASKGVLTEGTVTKTKPIHLTGFGFVLSRALKAYHERKLRAKTSVERYMKPAVPLA